MSLLLSCESDSPLLLLQPSRLSVTSVDFTFYPKQAAKSNESQRCGVVLRGEGWDLLLGFRTTLAFTVLGSAKLGSLLNLLKCHWLPWLRWAFSLQQARNQSNFLKSGEGSVGFGTYWGQDCEA